MAISMVSLLPLSLSLLLLINGSLAETRFGAQNRCRLDRITAQEPARRIESQAGVTELYSQNNQQFECAGVAFQRRIINPHGLLLPSFFNAPRLIYILQGRGISGTIMPGCPESFQQFQRQREMRGEERRSERDQHQRITPFRKGDVLALPAGVAHWAYNDGEQPIIAITLQFLLAGRKQRGQRFSFEPTREESEEEEDAGENILSGFDTETLSHAMGISRELAEKVKGRNDNRGEIVTVEEEFRIIRPSRMEEERRGEYGYEEERERQRPVANGFEQAFCSMRIKENINDPSRADIYSPNAGRITLLNSQKLPILSFLLLNAEKGVVRKNALISPHWNINAHAIVYITRGHARFEIVNQRGSAVHNSEARQGQVVVVPQQFATLIRASNEGFEYVAFFTNDNAVVSNLIGRDSVFRGLPEEVIMSSYRISREDARKVKYSRGEEIALLEPRSQQRRYA